MAVPAPDRPPRLAPPPTPPAPLPGAAVPLRYLESSPILVRGPVTGRQYQFSATYPQQLVDVRDAEGLVRTRFFRRAAPFI
jgi:hypothetical protein